MNNNDKPILFSKLTLIIFSAFSCIFSGLLYIENLRQLRKNNHILSMLIFSIAFTVILNKLLISTGIPSYYYYVPINLLGGLIQIKPFWDNQIGSIDYKSRNVIGPAIVVLGLIVAFALFVILIKHK